MVRSSKKSPVAGKRSSYAFFVKACFEEHKKSYPGENVRVNDLSAKCSAKWKEMTDVEKERFQELANKDRVRFTAEKAAYGDEGASTSRRKAKRAKKDPLAPKRPLSAFFFFSKEQRAAVCLAHPEWSVVSVAQEMGRLWKALIDEQKKPYQDKATADKQRYEGQVRQFKETGTVQAETAAAADEGAAAAESPMDGELGADELDQQ